VKRRNVLKALVAATGAASLASGVLRAQQQPPTTGAAPTPPAPAGTAPTAPTPKKVVDPEPQVNDIDKYPRCNYCNMDRKRFHHSRMLIHYSDDMVDPLCSLRCAASSLMLNLGRGPKALWVGDNASPAEIKPLIDAEKARYLIGSSIKGVMTKRSKVAYLTAEAAEASLVANGGDVVDFDKALLAAYTDVSESVSLNLKNKEERLRRMQKEQKEPGR
jgi:nitrous oxide reductase accessory protein NosL